MTGKLRKHIINGLVCACVFISLHVQAQKNQQLQPTLGIQIRPVVPSSLFTNTNFNYPRDSVLFNIRPKTSFSAGVVLRLGLRRQFSLQTGINYTKRNYQLNITQGDFSTSNKFRFVDYEVPILGLIYIRIAEKAYVNTAFGFSLDFFPNDIATENEYYKQLALRNGWIQPALLAEVGAEYRTEKAGFFYLGGSYHRMFGNTIYTSVEYERNGFKQILPATGLTGSYFAFDIKYFFPTTRTEPVDYF